MSKELAPGTRVKVVDRLATAADARSRLFFEHFRNLTGSVVRTYADGQEVQVNVDLDSLPPDLQARHEGAQEQMQKRIHESLSDEARRRMGDEALQVRLPYSILVSPDDLEVLEKGGPKERKAGQRKAEAPRSEGEQAQAERGAGPPGGRTASGTASSQADSVAKHPRPTARDLDRRERELLEQRARSRGDRSPSG